MGCLGWCGCVLVARCGVGWWLVVFAFVCGRVCVFCWAGESVFVCFLWVNWVVVCVLVSRGVRVGLLVVVLLVGGVGV